VATGLEGALDRLEFLLIQRRDSLGFIDILRGKYRLGDTAYISQQLRGMTGTEQAKLLAEPFDSLWEGLWGPSADGGTSYRHEKEQSRAKLEQLRASGDLAKMLAAVGQPYETPEWGFPKGRREAYETEYACALRETWEETGLSEKDLVPIKNLEPIRELFFGSNNIQYCHKYFVLYMPEERPIALDPANEHMRREVGDIRWCSVEEGLRLIRPENTEKREVLNRVSRLLRNYCPLKTF
jgi:8-oxo-dGTP pyrophosphatase MutT (NUDIX family)